MPRRRTSRGDIARAEESRRDFRGLARRRARPPSDRRARARAARGARRPSRRARLHALSLAVETDGARFRLGTSSRASRRTERVDDDDDDAMRASTKREDDEENARVLEYPSRRSDRRPRARRLHALAFAVSSTSSDARWRRFDARTPSRTTMTTTTSGRWRRWRETRASTSTSRRAKRRRRGKDCDREGRWRRAPRGNLEDAS